MHPIMVFKKEDNFMKIKVSSKENEPNLVNKLVDTIKDQNLKHKSPYTYVIKDQDYQKLSIKQIDQVAKKLDCGIDFKNINHQLTFDFSKTYEKYVDSLRLYYLKKAPCYSYFFIAYVICTFITALCSTLNVLSFYNILTVCAKVMLFITIIASIYVFYIQFDSVSMLKALYKSCK